MKKLRQKLHSNSGESLVETLVSIVIVVFASLLLLMSTVTATRFNKKAQELSTAYTDELEKAELQSDGSWSGKVTISGDGITTPPQISVSYYGQAGKLSSYTMDEAGG